MSWNLLQRFIESDHFNNDPFLSVAYLSRYANHVGIHYVLCSKLRQFSYEEIEFFLPQLCHLVVSVDNESMALEEFIIDLCIESANGALLTYLHDLAGSPQASEFKTCRRVLNRVQRIVFGSSGLFREEKLKENILPVAVLSSLILAGLGSPTILGYAGPLAVGQARRPRSSEDTISDMSQSHKLARSQTIAAESLHARRSKAKQTSRDPLQAESLFESRRRQASHRRTSERKPLSRTASGESNGKLLRPSHLKPYASKAQLCSNSLPDVTKIHFESRTPPLTGKSFDGLNLPQRPRSRPNRLSASWGLPLSQKVHLLRSNYFRSEIQFLTALEDISNRLVVVPKPARLSALRAELALIAQDLPAEVDIPVISPPTLIGGSPAQSKHHRIVRLNPAEATVLNSAERVPYLLMVEILPEDFDFDPATEENEKLLAKLISEDESYSRRLFDLTDTSRPRQVPVVETEVIDSVFEPVKGDLGSHSLIVELHDSPLSTAETLNDKQLSDDQRSIGASSDQNLAPLHRAHSPALARESPSAGQSNLPVNRAGQVAEQPDFSALATHMRAAAQMLAQLDSSVAKRPKGEVAAIKERIIASMQSLEEQSFDTEESRDVSTFEAILPGPVGGSTMMQLENPEKDLPSQTVNINAGAARMENDQKTGGMERRGDRDDPSAVTFGEEWNAKKERIRKSSPFGHMRNWDLLSVIVKTGADLRQEAFACQLVEICGRIWHDVGVPVWVKEMKILVTGDSSGLIQTITNGVSLHSLKRSLTLSTIAAGKNPRRRIVSLKDHFIKTFGSTESESYLAAQKAFLRSLAAYSIFSYVFQLKDRHNGNILIDDQGRSVGFEAAPFKLTQEYIDVLGGVTSPAFEEFKSLCKQAFQALRKSADSIVMLVEMMGKQSKMPCFAAGVVQTTNSLRQRFQLQLSQDDAEKFVETDLIGKSLGSYYTRLYDAFQYRTQGIY
ncbi:MAG: Phosphatidylinositol 4-kinase pik1alpha (PI4-kinase)(PtdIns-4-kinase) [Peltula sp. TS41687]|nr:MAG: Phosphatidylinositol 4-kinase pik1alpha (PI4-kinase)(PtdIns-4-kinase) [Peltula sp. TS41687]